MSLPTGGQGLPGCLLSVGGLIVILGVVLLVIGAIAGAGDAVLHSTGGGRSEDFGSVQDNIYFVVAGVVIYCVGLLLSGNNKKIS